MNKPTVERGGWLTVERSDQIAKAFSLVAGVAAGAFAMRLYSTEVIEVATEFRESNYFLDNVAPWVAAVGGGVAGGVVVHELIDNHVAVEIPTDTHLTSE